jgi:CheY-like chemotaxis protein/nucleoside 2-deoxyribosyltransferase
MKTTILVIDDERDFLNRCATAMQAAGYDCELCESAEQAHDKFQQRIYDGIVCDILIPFHGIRDGGLVLAREFASKYPTSCMVLVSQFVTAKWVNQFAGFPNHAFVEKGETVIEDLIQEIGRIAKTKFAFVCMPFAQEFEDFYDSGIKPVVLECGFKCVRADELQHNKGILEVVYDRIKSAHIVVADMTGRNPNVYYEVGYAHALGKEVVLLAQRADDLPFDLRGFNHVIYESRITVLKEKLNQRLKSMLTDGSGKSDA